MSKAAPRSPDGSTVRRIGEVLTLFLDAWPDVGVSEVARTLHRPKSVVHRMLVGLVETGFLSADPVTRRYRLGPKAFRLGLAALANIDVPVRALPYLRVIRDETGETAILSLLRGDVRVYAEQIESRESVRQTVQIGGEAPLHVGASGKAIAAFLPPDRRAAVLARARGVRLANGRALDPTAMERDLALVRRRRYAVSASERVIGAVSVSGPIFDHSGAVIGSLSAAGVSVRSDAVRLARYGRVVRSQADALSRELGWRGQA